MLVEYLCWCTEVQCFSRPLVQLKRSQIQVCLRANGQVGAFSQVGETQIPVTVPLAFALSGEGLCAGWDSLTPAAYAYDDEFHFSGTIRQVVVELAD